MKLDRQLNNIILGAFYEAKQGKHEFVTPEHVLYSLLFSQEGIELIEGVGGDISRLRIELKKHLDTMVPRTQSGDLMQSFSFQQLLDLSAQRASSAGKPQVSITDMLVSLYDCEESHAAFYLAEQGIEQFDLIKFIAHGLPELQEAAKAGDGSVKPQKKGESDAKSVEAFTVDLTALAEKGELEPLIGRDAVVTRTVQVLCRKTKNNPVIVGEPGVGKTAITEGLAQRIVAGTVPEPLKGHRVYRIDMGSMLAGTKYRGDFEERMKKVLNHLMQRENIIIVIDEIHTIVGAGAVSGGAMDASNILKPILTTGRIKCIGSTTHDEYRKHFEKDRALSRRFQKIDLPEMTVAETVAVLEGIRGRYEKFHAVRYTDAALAAAAELSARFVTERFLPDKAIDLIDEAGAFTRISGEKKKVIDTGEIERVVSLIARIPEQTVSSGEGEKLRRLEGALKKQIFGQDGAIKAVVEAIKRSRAGFGRPERPVASFLFVGPTGVGKTELARQMARELGITLHRFDMSEYQEKHTVSRLIGAPPGYVGYEEGGLLTELVRKTPHAVVLLDEIEKAHSDIYNTLLQIMDYATLTDNAGRKADFRNVILVMTSNAGAREIGKAVPGFGERAIDGGELERAVERIFAPEFRNRLDRVVKFERLDIDIITDIVKKQVSEFAVQLKEKKVTLTVTAAAYRYLAELGFSKEFGAREVGRLVQEQVKDFFVDEVLFGRLKEGGKARATYKNGRFLIEIPR
ncbi:MAG TPA: ATP-dependent Clp protease ATP-binding subunit ClpA [bacterium]|nr:ATP-dependent Clp protease ATP-binding subunit ClpA [bacterium]